MNQNILDKKLIEDQNWVIQVQTGAKITQKSKYKILDKTTKDFALKQLGPNPNRQDFVRVSQELQIAVKNLKRWHTRGTSRKEGCGRKKLNLAAEYELQEYILNFTTEKGRKISRAEIRNKAIELFQNPNFQASKGFLDRFIRQHELKYKVINALQSMNKLSRYQKNTYNLKGDNSTDYEKTQSQLLSSNITPNFSPNLSRSLSLSSISRSNLGTYASSKLISSLGQEVFENKDLKLSPSNDNQKFESKLSPSFDQQKFENLYLKLSPSLCQEKFQKFEQKDYIKDTKIKVEELEELQEEIQIKEIKIYNQDQKQILEPMKIIYS